MMEKTFKRETALILLATVIGLSVASIWEPEARAAAELIVWPVFMFAGAAFGMDAYAKQMR